MPRKHRHQKGGSLKDVLSEALDGAKNVAKEAARLAKDNKVLSDAIKAGGFTRLGNMVDAAGYGKRKPHKRTMKGGSIFGDIAGGLLSVPASVISGGLGGLVGSVRGLGRRRMKGGAVIPEEAMMRRNWQIRNAVIDPAMYGMGRAPKIFA